MKRFYYERTEGLWPYNVFDAMRSNTVPIGQATDVTTAEMVVQSLNKYWEVTHDEPATASPAAVDPR